MTIASWKILVVDDEPGMQRILALVLEAEGAQVSQASTGEEAWDIMSVDQPTVLITDLGLPGMDGWQLLQAMRANPTLAKVPAVAMTADHSPELVERILQAGFLGYFRKPIRFSLFVDQLVALCEEKHFQA